MDTRVLDVSEMTPQAYCAREHPKRKHFANDLCRECYDKQRVPRSGAHVHKHCKIPATDDERTAWAKAFAEDGHVKFAPWARAILNERAEALGFVPATKVGEREET